MPHSSGGGSHSSGSFHSSSSSSHSSHSNEIRKPIVRRHSHFPGSRRYVYYRYDGPHYIYLDNDISEAKEQLDIKEKIILYTISLILISFGIILLLTSYHTPNKLSTNNNYRIIDDINIINDKPSLNNSLKDFKDLTGIPVVIKTVNNEIWIDNYVDIESYAYEQYLLEYQDECGWLILYSSSKTVSDFDDWHWWGMQGNDTDDILSNEITDKFGKELQDRLLRKEPLETALISSLSIISESCMNTRFQSDRLPGAIIMLIFGLFLMIITIISSIQQRKEQEERGYKDSELQEVNDNELMENCPFCGKEFFKGNFTKCPYCKGILYK